MEFLLTKTAISFRAMPLSKLREKIGANGDVKFNLQNNSVAADVGLSYGVGKIEGG